MMVQEPTFAYCIGATKAGTSWLYDYLRSHPQTHVRGIKEVHYFDAIDHDSREWHAAWFAKRRDRLAAKVANFPTEENREELADYTDLCALHDGAGYDRRAYRAYLTDGAAPEHKVVADITPAYSTLSREMFKTMAQAAANTRFIYILRDPISRLWSHIKMNAGRRANSPEELPMRANRIFWRFGRGRHPGIWARSDYKGTLERLNSALAPNQLLVLFYEELFTNEAVELICTFLGLSPHKADFAARVNVSADLPMDHTKMAHARGWLAAQYDHIQKTIDHLPTVWQDNMQRVPA